MKAMLAERHGEPEVLQLTEIAAPQPGPDEVLVRNHYIGVNYVDTRHRAGIHFVTPLPLIPGIEAAGTVIAVGAQVSAFAVGDRVVYAGYMGGVYAEMTSVPQDRLIAVPAAMSLAKAAAGLQQAITAYVLTHEVYALKAGEVALVLAAAGGVGSMLVQMAKNLGATVIGTTSTEEKAAIVRQDGADHVILYTQEDVVEATRRLTGQQGVHVVYDGVGGNMLDKVRVLRTRGILVCFGLTNKESQMLDISQLSGLINTQTRGSLFVTWASVGDYLNTAEARRACAAAVFEEMLAGRLQVHITATFPLEHATEAHRLLEARKTSGKLMLKVM